MNFPNLNPHSQDFFALAPMEGVMDANLRQILTDLGGVNLCVSEFIRVTQSLHPKKVFHRFVPELASKSMTVAGTPVAIQLLGGDPEWLALNAQRAFSLGAASVDINFGCPAKTVNRHDGGACLLQFPERIFKIMTQVRKVNPKPLKVSAKIRLGYNDKNLVNEIASAIESAGADWLTVHCRTKAQGYRPPADWEAAALLIEKVKLPVIVNGDLFRLEDFKKCKQITQTKNFMIGRGILKNPFLIRSIRQHLEQNTHQDFHPDWQDVLKLLHCFYKLQKLRINSSFASARTKQWLKYLCLDWPEAQTLFHEIKSFKGEVFMEKLFDLNLLNSINSSRINHNVRINHYFA